MPFVSKDARLDHFDRHRSEFSFKNDKEYEEAAEKFMSGTVTEPTRQGIRPRGDRVRYDRVSGCLGVIASSGILRTFHRPSDRFRHKAYFEWECGKGRQGV